MQLNEIDQPKQYFKPTNEDISFMEKAAKLIFALYPYDVRVKGIRVYRQQPLYHYPILNLMFGTFTVNQQTPKLVVYVYDDEPERLTSIIKGTTSLLSSLILKQYHHKANVSSYTPKDWLTEMGELIILSFEYKRSIHN